MSELQAGVIFGTPATLHHPNHSSYLALSDSNEKSSPAPKSLHQIPPHLPPILLQKEANLASPHLDILLSAPSSQLHCPGDAASEECSTSKKVT